MGVCARNLLSASVSLSLVLMTCQQSQAETPPPASYYTLEEVIALALERNPAVVRAEGFVDESQGRRVVAEAYPNPTFQAQTAAGVVRDPDGPRIVERYAGLSQPFEWSEKRAARQRVAQAGVTSAFAGLEEVRLNLVADVKVAFYELLVALRDLELARQNQNIVEEVGRAVKTRVLSGEAPEFEAIKADVEVMKANQVVTRAQNVVRIRRVTLDTLTANALGDNYAIRGDFRVYPRELSLNALTARALDRHPTIRRLLSRVERTRHQIVFEQEARMPNVTVAGQYQRDAGREAWVAALSIPIPIWYQRQGEILAAMGLKRQEEAELLRTRNDIARAVTQHFQEAQTANQQITLFEKGLIALSEEALRIAQFSFRQGAASLLEVLDAQRVFRDTQLNYAHARFDLSLALVRLERTVGGEL